MSFPQFKLSSRTYKGKDRLRSFQIYSQFCSDTAGCWKVVNCRRSAIIIKCTQQLDMSRRRATTLVNRALLHVGRRDKALPCQVLMCKSFSSGYGDKASRIGEFKSPIVKSLWERRIVQRELERSESPIVDRKPSESRITLPYNFSSDEFLRESYSNPWGFMRKGKLLEDLDACAGNIAFNHCQRENKVPLLVTASVDRIRLITNPKLDIDMEMSGQVVWVGKSSMLIQMTMTCKGDDRPWVHARFTFVARDQKTGRAVEINRLVPETEEEKALFQEEEQRDQRLKERRRREKAGKPPPAEDTVIDKEAVIRLLLQQARPLIEMPCLADPTCVLIDTTRLSNSTTMQPQQRNMLSRIFGGFLMRRAYEIAFSTAYLFGGSRPEFAEVAHIDFKLPVDVGDLVRFDSCVLYTKSDAGIPEVHVQVVAFICRPEQVESKISNTFDFTFTLSDKPTCRKVLPSNLDQARRMVDWIEADLLADRTGR